MNLFSHRRYRLAVVEKIAAIYEGDPKRHKDRIKKDWEEAGIEGNFPEEETSPRTLETPEGKTAYQEFLAKIKKLPNPENTEEIPYLFREKLKSLGIDPDKEPVGLAEKARIDGIISELLPYATIGLVQGAGGFDRHYVDPYRPETSTIHKYFGYYDKERKEWHPTQYSYVLFFMANFSNRFDLEVFKDKSRMFRAPQKHPYKNNYNVDEIFTPFTVEMEDRITKNFSKILAILKQVHWKTNFKTKEGLEFLLPVAPHPRKSLVESTQIRYENGTFFVRGPARTEGMQVVDETVAQEEVAKSTQVSLVEDLIKDINLYQNLARSITAIKSDYMAIEREILKNKREFQFLRGNDAGKEMVANVIARAVSEVIKVELIDFIKSR